MAARLKSVARRITPDWAKNMLRSARRKRRWAKVQQSRVITRSELAADIRAMGLGSGDTVMVHSSLSRLGFVDGGPEAVIEAILEVVGPDGLIVMPAFPTTGYALDYLASKPLFDPDLSPSNNGKITEVFRHRPGAMRSIHATHSVSAYGPGAAELVRDHYRSPTPFGPDTPFRRLLAAGALVMGVGVDLGSLTFYHVFPEFAGQYPFQPYYPEIQQSRVLTPAGEVIAPTTVLDPRLAPYRPDHDVAAKAALTNKLLGWNLVRFGRMGEGRGFCLRTTDLMVGLQRMLDEGLTIYNTERMLADGLEVPPGLARKLPS